MGRIIAKRLKGMNWMAKVSLILIFTVFLSIFLFKPDEAAADTHYSIANTAWATASTWSTTACGGAAAAAAPVAGDDAVICAGTTPTLGAVASITNITINSTGTLEGSTFLLTVTGNYTNNGTHSGSGGATLSTGTNIGGTGSITNTGTFTISSAKTIANTADLTFAGTIAISGAITVTNNGTITSNAAGGITGSVAGSTWVNAANSTLKVTGPLLATGVLTATAVPNTVNYQGAAQTVKGTTYVNLTLSGSGAKTTTGVTVTGILSMEGTATASAVPTYGAAATLQYNKPAAFTASVEWLTTFAASGGVIIANAGTITMNAAKVFNASIPLTINSGATLNTSATNYQLTFGGNFVNNGGTLTANASPIVIADTMAAQSIAGFTTTGLVSMTKTGGVATFAGNVNGAGLTINGVGGTLNLGTGLTHTFTGVVTLTNGTLNGGSSTLKENMVSATAWNGTGTNFVAGTGTVNFGAAGNQTIACATTFNNLTLSGSGIKTLGAATVVNGNLTISAGQLDVSATNYGLTVNGNWTNTPGGVTGFNARAGTVTFNGAGLQTINNSNTWYGLSITAAAKRRVTFESGKTQTIAAGGSLTLTGASAAQPLTLAPSAGTTAWLLNKDAAITPTISSVAVSFSNAGGGGQIDASGVTNSNAGNNTNWKFSGGTIASCVGCHGYGAFPDGTARNTPDGAFLGSHNKHVVTYSTVCSVCHIAPATETSADFKHRNGTITMASPINGNTGAAYTKGSSWAQTNTPSAFTACTNTYCHSKGQSPFAAPLTAINWSGGTSNCTSTCHGGNDTYANVTANGPIGQHKRHIATTATNGYNYTCDECHAETVAANTSTTLHATTGYTKHVNTEKNWKFSDNISYPDGTPSRDSGFSQATGSYASSQCTNLYCHSKGTRRTADPVTYPYTGDHAPYTTPTWTATLTCNGCHGDASNTDGRPAYANNTPKNNSHQTASHKSKGCQECHWATTQNGTSIVDRTKHVNFEYNVSNSAATLSYTPGAVGGTGIPVGGQCTALPATGCHGAAQWGVTAIDCINCHTTAQGTRRAIVPEFGANWSHKKTGGPVTKFDCGVCHMEGSPTTGAASGVHNDGKIDLRDPDTGATITNFSAVTYTFTTFSTRFDLKATVAATNNTDYIVAQRFCLKCHDAGGAANSAAWVSDGTAAKPFGTLGGTVLNIDAHFATSNAAAHPVKGPRSNDYCNSNTMNAPYNATKTVDTTPTAGVVITCWDCHNITGSSPWTTRTIDAHGSGTNTSILRGGIYQTYVAPGSATSTLCGICHSTYTTYASSATTFPHGTRGNMQSAGMSGACQICHSEPVSGAELTGTTKPTRPKPAENVHGTNTQLAWPSAGGDTRPFAFLRNNLNFASWRARQVVGGTLQTTWGCSMRSANSNTCKNNAMPFTDGTFDNATNYGPGGIYPNY